MGFWCEERCRKVEYLALPNCYLVVCLFELKTLGGPSLFFMVELANNIR